MMDFKIRIHKMHSPGFNKPELVFMHFCVLCHLILLHLFHTICPIVLDQPADKLLEYTIPPNDEGCQIPNQTIQFVSTASGALVVGGVRDTYIYISIQAIRR